MLRTETEMNLRRETAGYDYIQVGEKSERQGSKETALRAGK